MIYLELIGEGTDVWRPVEAELLDDDVYRITSSLDDPDEVWRFLPGELVRCERRHLSLCAHPDLAGTSKPIPGSVPQRAAPCLLKHRLNHHQQQ